MHGIQNHFNNLPLSQIAMEQNAQLSQNQRLERSRVEHAEKAAAKEKMENLQKNPQQRQERQPHPEGQSLGTSADLPEEASSNTGTKTHIDIRV